MRLNILLVPLLGLLATWQLFCVVVGVSSAVASGKVSVEESQPQNNNNTFPSQHQLQRFNLFIQNCISSHPNPPFSTPKIYVDLAGEMGIGAFAAEDISKEDIYMFMPWHCVMSVELFLSQEAPFVDAVSQYFGFQKGTRRGERGTDSGRPDDFHLILFYLLWEKEKGEKSFFFPYIDILPRHFETPYYWTEEELEHLRGSSIYSQVLQERETIRSTFNRLRQGLFQINKPLFNFVTFANYQWAYHILNSRTIWVSNSGRVRSLVPLLDAINCKELSDPTRLHVSARSLPLNAVITKSPDSFKRGEQVFENYGSDNNQNFFSHAFVLSPNTHDCVRLDISVNTLLNLHLEKLGLLHNAEERDIHRRRVVERMERMRIPHSLTTCLPSPSNSGRATTLSFVPERARHYLRALTQLSPTIQPEEILLSQLKSHLQSYPSNLSFDKKQYAFSSPLTIRRKQALQFLISEKALLQSIHDQIVPLVSNRVNRDEL